MSESSNLLPNSADLIERLTILLEETRRLKERSQELRREAVVHSAAAQGDAEDSD